MNNFVYDSYDKALFDLKLFSGMIAHEDKTVFLCSCEGGYAIIYSTAVAACAPGGIRAIAINGKLYVPTS